jgi:hypothetical protein
MTEYRVFKEERFVLENGNYDRTEVKYICEVVGAGSEVQIGDRTIDVPMHPYTDDDKYRLFNKIASLYQKGDRIRTINESEISDGLDGEVIELMKPLNHDELKVLAVTLLKELSGKQSS